MDSDWKLIEMEIGMRLIYDGIFSDFGNKKNEGLPGIVPENLRNWNIIFI